MPHLYYKSRIKFVLISIAGVLTICVFAILPILLAVTAGSVAEHYRCRADEAGSYPCVIGGIDYGELVSFLGVFGWLFLMSFPAAFFLIVLWISKINKGLKFVRDGEEFALADLQNINSFEFEKRLYLEATVTHLEQERMLRIIFSSKKEENKYKEKKGTRVLGILKEVKNNPILVLDTSIIR